MLLQCCTRKAESKGPISWQKLCHGRSLFLSVKVSENLIPQLCRPDLHLALVFHPHVKHTLLQVKEGRSQSVPQAWCSGWSSILTGLASTLGFGGAHFQVCLGHGGTALWSVSGPQSLPSSQALFLDPPSWSPWMKQIYYAIPFYHDVSALDPADHELQASESSSL